MDASALHAAALAALSIVCPSGKQGALGVCLQAPLRRLAEEGSVEFAPILLRETLDPIAQAVGVSVAQCDSAAVLLKLYMAERRHLPARLPPELEQLARDLAGSFDVSRVLDEIERRCTRQPAAPPPQVAITTPPTEPLARTTPGMPPFITHRATAPITPRTTKVPHRIATTVKLPEAHTQTRLLLAVLGVSILAGPATFFLFDSAPSGALGLQVMAGPVQGKAMAALDRRAVQAIASDAHVEPDGEGGAKVWFLTDAFSRLTPAAQADRARQIFIALALPGRPGPERLLITSGQSVYTARRTGDAVVISDVGAAHRAPPSDLETAATTPVNEPDVPDVPKAVPDTAPDSPQSVSTEARGPDHDQSNSQSNDQRDDPKKE